MNGAIRYKVTVVAVVERQEKGGKEWARTTAEPNAPFAYTPEIEKTVLREITAYEQTFDKLDMPTVVAVLNGITPVGYKKV